MKLLPLVEENPALPPKMLQVESEEGRRNKKIARELQRKFGGSYPYYDIIDPRVFHNRAMIRSNNTRDYDREMQSLTKDYQSSDYILSFDYRGGEFVVTWKTPVGHPGGDTIDNLIKKLAGMLGPGITDYTIKNINGDEDDPYISYYHINGKEIHVPFKREEKQREPFEPPKQIPERVLVAIKKRYIGRDYPGQFKIVAVDVIQTSPPWIKMTAKLQMPDSQYGEYDEEREKIVEQLEQEVEKYFGVPCGVMFQENLHTKL